MSETHELLKSQKNDVFEFIKRAGLEPANFSWTDIHIRGKGKIFPRLNYLDGNYYFVFGLRDEGHFCLFSPAAEQTLQGVVTGSWAYQMNYFNMWLNYLEREIKAPDLWAEMGKYKTSVSLALPEQLLNEPISASEAEEIAEKMGILADMIEKQFQLTAEQDKFVRNKLNYLAEAAKRQRSSDWIYTSIGVFISIATALTLSPERGKELWLLFKSILGGFIHLIG
jgi:hypothetical protein